MIFLLTERDDHAQHGMMQTYVNNNIEQLIEGIVREVHPLRILLFGSAVAGQTGPDSDLDLLVVMPEGVHRRKIAQRLYQKIRGIDFPFDIVVATPTDLEKHRHNRGLIYTTILEHGREVYAA